MTPEQKVADAATKVVSARAELRDAIREAQAAGIPLRTIAYAAGVSHEQVRRIAG